jgi:hypothetical protein
VDFHVSLPHMEKYVLHLQVKNVVKDHRIVQLMVHPLQFSHVIHPDIIYLQEDVTLVAVGIVVG